MSHFVSPFTALNQINRELNRVFDDRPITGQLVDSTIWKPQVDICENANSFKVIADVPGVDPKDIEISLHNGLLTIRGERKTDTEVEEDKFSRRERVRGTFSRQFNLPDSADAQTVSARSENGVLEVTIPKAKKARPINIAVDGD
ncbi:MAG: Hsp20/alpha crystallin family protein [Gammaproteobacteria bacterium]|jgi:HSP20 family protein|nr:Hsp20/alpha crystallin family protein [Gammaproteobacteria bacterium]MBT4493178.1 Hsp20/alpha crystallin family protein [Gammaproteobacteria bacterium]MBT7372296.1 Hsp20/alpha crystallin family protein [Gammaproteobacteria bacterium]